MKKVVVIVLVLVLGIAVAVIAAEIYGSSKVTYELPKQPSVVSEGNGQEVSTVVYTDQGFTPRELTLTKGTTVQFVNESSIPLWVASDPHPEHTDYPEFDTTRAMGGKMPKINEDFSFTFDKTGTWSFHSHNASSDTGTEEVHPGKIIVK